MFRKLKQLNKFVRPTEEQDQINRLRIERELLEQQNIVAAKTLDDKRKTSGLDYKSCKKIEDEHFAKIEKLESEYLDLVEKVEVKNKELLDAQNILSITIESENYLKNIIPTLKQIKVKLEKEIHNTTFKFNTDKSFMDRYLYEIRLETTDAKAELNSFIDKFSEAKVEFNKLIEATHLENKVLSIRKKDLEIYELRLRKQYPGAKIIL